MNRHKVTRAITLSIFIAFIHVILISCEKNYTAIDDHKYSYKEHRFEEDSTLLVQYLVDGVGVVEKFYTLDGSEKTLLEACYALSLEEDLVECKAYFYGDTTMTYQRWEGEKHGHVKTYSSDNLIAQQFYYKGQQRYDEFFMDEKRRMLEYNYYIPLRSKESFQKFHAEYIYEADIISRLLILGNPFSQLFGKSGSIFSYDNIFYKDDEKFMITTARPPHCNKVFRYYLVNNKGRTLFKDSVTLKQDDDFIQPVPNVPDGIYEFRLNFSLDCPSYEYKYDTVYSISIL